MKKRTLLLTAMVLSLSWFAGLAQAQATNPITHCQTLSTPNASYSLASDTLTNTASGPCLILDAPNISIMWQVGGIEGGDGTAILVTKRATGAVLGFFCLGIHSNGTAVE